MTWAGLGILAAVLLLVVLRLWPRRRWQSGTGSEDPDRREDVYWIDLPNGGRIDVIWHDGDATKWQWFLYDRSGEAVGVSERLFSTADEAMKSASRYAGRL